MKDWLHLPSLGRTIDFSLVSDIVWNYQDRRDKTIGRFRTLVLLGTDLVDTPDVGITQNELFIWDKEDREKVYAKFPGIPIELLFDRVPAEEVTATAGKSESYWDNWLEAGKEKMQVLVELPASVNKSDERIRLSVFPGREKQYQQFLVIREELQAIGVEFGELISSQDDVKGWNLKWYGDKAGLFWTLGGGWSVEALEPRESLSGVWENFDLTEQLYSNDIDLDWGDES